MYTDKEKMFDLRSNLETLITYVSTDVIDELFEQGFLRYPLCESESSVRNAIQNVLHRYESNFVETIKKQL